MRHPLPICVVVTCLLACGAAAGQTSQSLKERALDTGYLRTYAETRGFMLGRPVKAKPTPDGKAVLFLRSQPRVARLDLFEFDMATGKTRELLTTERILHGTKEQLSAEERARRERMRVSLGGFTDFQISGDGRLVLLLFSGKLFVLERGSGKTETLATGPGAILDPKFSPDAKSVAYVRDYDLYVMDLATKTERPVTSGGSERLTHGLAEFVAQEEMHRYSGYWWAPNSQGLAFEEADTKAVETWYVADPARPDQKPHPSFYPRPGQANARVRLGVVSLAGGPPRWIDWDRERYPYLARVAWDENSPLTLEVQTRDQKEIALLKPAAGTGELTTLLTESDSAWVDLPHGVPRWLPDDKGFLWINGGKDGPRLERRAQDGKLLAILCPADAGFQALVHFSPEPGEVVFQASKDPTQSHLFRVTLDGSKPVPLTSEPGLHAASFGKGVSIYVRETVQLTAMPRSTVHDHDGRVLGELPSVAEEPPFIPKAEIVKVDEGRGFYALVNRPRDFDPARRYPVIVYVYGGPTVRIVQAAMHNRLLLNQWLADQGFVIVSLDGRGTPGRGHDWERAVDKHFGTVPLEDQVAGLQALGKRFPELDLSRVGITGWSFGGYMSALAVLKRPDIYKAAVAGAPVVDWLDYDTHYTERYLGMPDTDAAAYKEASLLTYAPDLKRPLLLVHGTADDNVYFRHTLKLANTLFRNGRSFELLPLSGLTHMVPEPLVMEQLWSRIAVFFETHLGKPR